jgi:hypothetical protein
VDGGRSVKSMGDALNTESTEAVMDVKRPTRSQMLDLKEGTLPNTRERGRARQFIEGKVQNMKGKYTTKLRRDDLEKSDVYR